MNRWLLKTEPREYCYADLVAEGRARWNGVRNNQALIHLRAFAPGDEVLIYHSGKVKAVIGLAEVVSEPYPDPEADDERFVVVDLEARRELPAPVSLTSIKADAAFANLGLVRISRLSVMPVPAPLWSRILRMAGADA